METLHPSAKAIDAAVDEHDGGQERAYVSLPPNLAGNRELCKKFHDHAFAFFEAARDQTERTELEENLASADAMYRMSKKRNPTVMGGAKKESHTLSNDSSSQFHKSIRLISNGQSSILFYGEEEEIPVRYDPLPDQSEYEPMDGKRLADGRNRYLGRVWHDNDWTNEIKRSVRRANKNSVEYFDLEWDYRTEKRRVKVPGYYASDGTPTEASATEQVPPGSTNGRGDEIAFVFDENGRPTSYVVVEKIKVVKNCPVIEFPKARNVYIDLTIDDLEKQTCHTIEFFPSFNDIIAQARDGVFLNAGEIGSNHLFEGETSDVHDDLKENKEYEAGEKRNGLYHAFKVKCYAPIVDWQSEKKAKWDEDAVPEIFEATFIGRYGEYKEDISQPDSKGRNPSVSCTCALLRRLPYNHGRFTLHKVHSHDDEDGAIHMGYQTLLECNVEEQTITLRQHIDNKTLLIKPPAIAQKGNLLSRDLVFRGGNDIKWANDPKTAVEWLRLPDATQSTLPFIEWLQSDADELLGTTEAFRGQFAGSRTTGTEYLGAREQAMKPAIEDAKFIAKQYFTPITRDVADLCDQFAPHWNLGDDLYADELYGENKLKITSVEKFEADLNAKQVLVNFIESGGYDKARADGAIGETGKLEFWRMTGKALKMPGAERIFDGARQYVEAENQAWADVRAIMADPMTAMENPEQLPKPGEMHDIHNRILNQVQLKLEIVKATRAPEEQEMIAQQIAALKYYQALHEQFKNEAEQQAQQQQAAMAQSAPNQAQQPPGMNGEAAGDTLAGIQGQQTI